MSTDPPRRETGGQDREPSRGSGSGRRPARPAAPDPLAPPPARACCCSARPMVKVLMPATKARPHSVDLWLCGHHWRVSVKALTGAGATVIVVTAPGLAPAGQLLRQRAPASRRTVA